MWIGVGAPSITAPQVSLLSCHCGFTSSLRIIWRHQILIVWLIVITFCTVVIYIDVLYYLLFIFLPASKAIERLSLSCGGSVLHTIRLYYISNSYPCMSSFNYSLIYHSHVSFRNREDNYYRNQMIHSSRWSWDVIIICTFSFNLSKCLVFLTYFWAQ